MKLVRLMLAAAALLAVTATTAEAHNKTFSSQNVWMGDRFEGDYVQISGRIKGNEKCLSNRKVKMVAFYPDGAGGYEGVLADVGRSSKNGAWSTGAVLPDKPPFIRLIAVRKRLPSGSGHRHFCSRAKFTNS